MAIVPYPVSAVHVCQVWMCQRVSRPFMDGCCRLQQSLVMMRLYACFRVWHILFEMASSMSC